MRRFVVRLQLQANFVETNLDAVGTQAMNCSSEHRSGSGNKLACPREKACREELKQRLPVDTVAGAAALVNAVEVP